MESVELVIVFGAVALICLILCVASFIAARKARDLNFKRDENTTRLAEKLTGQDMKVSSLELKVAQLQQRMDLEYLNKLQTTVENDPRHYPGTDNVTS